MSEQRFFFYYWSHTPVKQKAVQLSSLSELQSSAQTTEQWKVQTNMQWTSLTRVLSQHFFSFRQSFKEIDLFKASKMTTAVTVGVSQTWYLIYQYHCIRNKIIKSSCQCVSIASSHYLNFMWLFGGLVQLEGHLHCAWKQTERVSRQDWWDIKVYIC